MAADQEEPGTHLAPLFPRQHLRMLVQGGQAPVSIAGAGAVLVLDVSGFTDLSESFSGRGNRGAEQLSDLLKSLWGVVLPAVDERGGDVLAFAGDAVWVWWPAQGAERMREAALQASQVGLAATRGVEATSNLAQAGIRIRGGIAVGEARFLHLVQPSSRSLFVASGAVVVDAGAALAAATEGEVALSASAAELVMDRCTGRTKPSGVWVVQSTPVLAPRQLEAVPVVRATARSLRLSLPPAVIHRLDAGLGRWLAEFRYASVIFVGFPSADLDSPLPQLRDLFARIEAIAQELEGHVYQVLRDEKGLSAVVIFGLPPLTHENDPERAVRAASRFRDLVGGAEDGPEDGPDVAVATGLVFCDLAGTEERKTYMIAGPAMNLGAKLMQASRGRVLCDAATIRSIQASDLRFESLDLEPRGSNPTTVYQAISLDAPLRTTSRPGPLSSLVGRAEERRLFVDGLAAIVDGGSPRSLLIEGDAGVGKSAVVDFVRAESQRRGVPSYVEAADSLSEAIPYAPFRTLLRSMLGLYPTGRGVADLGVSAALETLGDRRELAALLNPILGLELPETELTRRLSEEGRAQATRDLLQACLVDRAPAVLILEDVQWLDPSTWGLLTQLIRDGARVWVILTGRPFERPGSLEALFASGRAELRKLGPLEEAAALEVVRAHLGVDRLPERAEAFLTARSGGNPRFGMEVARTLVEIGLLVVDGREAWLAPTVTDLERQFDDALANRGVSATLQGLINSRVDRLDLDEQQVLKIASVIGQGFSFDLLGAVAEASGVRGDLSEVVSRLCRARFLRQVGEPSVARIGTEHAVVADSVYSTIPFQHRRILHRLVAEWYERTPNADASHVLRAHHWARAEDPRGLEHFDGAGERFLMAHANEEAAKAYSGAFQLESSLGQPDSKPSATRGRRHLRLGRAFVNLSNYDAGVAHLEKGLRLSGRTVPRRAPGLVLGTLWGIIRQFLHYRFNRFFLGRRGGQRTRLLEQAHAYEGLTEAYFNLGNNLACFHYAFQSINTAELAGPSPAVARGYASLGAIVGFVPLVDSARAYCSRAKKVADAIDDPAAQAWVAVAAGVLEAGLGNWEAATALFHRTAELGRALGDGRRCDDATQNLAAVAFWRGRFAESMAWTDSLVESGRRRNDAFMHGDGLRRRAHWLLMCNRPDEAASVIDALADLRAAKRKQRLEKQNADIHVLQAALALARGAHADALGQAELAARILRVASPMFYDVLLEYACLADVACKLGATGYPTAWKIHDFTGKKLEGLARVFAIARPAALLSRASRYLRTGKKRRAEVAWSEAERWATGLTMPYFAALVHVRRRGGGGDPHTEVEDLHAIRRVWGGQDLAELQAHLDEASDRVRRDHDRPPV